MSFYIYIVPSLYLSFTLNVTVYHLISAL